MLSKKLIAATAITTLMLTACTIRFGKKTEDDASPTKTPTASSSPTPSRDAPTPTPSTSVDDSTFPTPDNPTANPIPTNQTGDLTTEVQLVKDTESRIQFAAPKSWAVLKSDILNKHIRQKEWNNISKRFRNSAHSIKQNLKTNFSIVIAGNPNSPFMNNMVVLKPMNNMPLPTEEALKNAINNKFKTSYIYTVRVMSRLGPAITASYQVELRRNNIQMPIHNTEIMFKNPNGSITNISIATSNPAETAALKNQILNTLVASN